MIKVPKKSYIDSKIRHIDLGTISDITGDNVAERFCNKLISLPAEAKTELSEKCYTGTFVDSMCYAFHMVYLNVGKGYLGAIVYTYYSSNAYFITLSNGMFSYRNLF